MRGAGNLKTLMDILIAVSNFMKRIFDLVLSLLGLLIFFLPMIFIALLIKRRLGHKVIFTQPRPGIGGKVFNIIKFRSMTDARDSNGILLPDDQRLTPLGKFLRSSSLDELPSLWNVVRGDLSLVGPRPLLVEYLPLYSPTQARRHEVRPGVTGWAQVNGRNALSWEEKFELDIWYVDNQTMWLDIKILWLTLRKVIVREGISAIGEATMPRFTGSDSVRTEL